MSRSLGQLTLDLVANIGGFTGPLDKAQREADKRAKEFARTQKGNERAINNMLRALDKEVSVLGKTAKEQKLMELATRGATKAQLAQAEASLDAIKAFEDQQKAMKDNIAFAKKAGTAIGAAFVAAGAAVAANVVHVVNSAKEIENLSRVANESAESFQRIAYAAKPFGVEQEKLADILKDVNDKVGDFLTTGQGPLADFFEKIAPQVGVTAEQFRNLSGSDALGLYIKSLEEAGVSQAEMTFFMEAIASDATLLLPLFKENGRELRRLTGEFDKFGGALSDVDIAKLKQADDVFRQLGAQGRAFSQEMAIAAIPAVNELAATLSDPMVVESGKALGGAIVTSVSAAVRTVAEAVQVLKFLAEELAVIRNGASADDLVRMDDQLRMMEEMRASMNPLNRIRFFGKDGFVEYYDDSELDAEIAKVRDAIEQATKNMAPPVNVAKITAEYDFPEMGDPFADFSAFNPYATLTESARKYLEQLEKQKTLSAENTELARVNFEIQRGGFGVLTEEQKEILRARASEIDLLKQQQKETENLNKIQEQADQYLRAVEQQLALINAETESEKILYEVQSGRYAMLDQAQKDALVRQAKMLDDAKAQIEVEREYKDLVNDLRTDEEKRTQQLRERLLLVDKMSGLSEAERNTTINRVVKTSFDTDPDKAKDDDFEGQRDELKKWYDEQLKMLEKFRSDRADLLGEWDQQELRTRAEYEQRLSEITLAEEEKRRQQLADGFSALFSVAAKYYEGMEGEEAAYTRAALQLGQLLLDEKKKESLQSIVASTHAAAMGAYESLSSIPYVGPVLGAAAAAGIYVAGGAASAAVLGMAHDGIDSVPATGTWLLEKGERVVTSETSAKLDATLDRIGGQSGGDVTVNLIEDRDKAGQVNQRIDPANEQARIIDVFVANIQSDGRAAQAIQTKFGLSPRGR